MKESHAREKNIVRWLTKIKCDATAIYLVGDIFDFWFEYKKVVPKGFVRILGKLAEISDEGIKIHLFVGNHDLWAKDYLETEVGITIHHKSKIIQEQGKKILISHGDDLGSGNYIYKYLRRIFTSKICQWIFARLHPNFAFSIAHAWSNKSRKRHETTFISKEQERLFNYCQEQQQQNPVDYYIFGHRHIPLEIKIKDNASYINLGDWINHYTYAVLEKGIVQLKKYKK